MKLLLLIFGYKVIASFVNLEMCGTEDDARLETTESENEIIFFIENGEKGN